MGVVDGSPSADPSRVGVVDGVKDGRLEVDVASTEVMGGSVGGIKKPIQATAISFVPCDSLTHSQE